LPSIGELTRWCCLLYLYPHDRRSHTTCPKAALPKNTRTPSATQRRRKLVSLSLASSSSPLPSPPLALSLRLTGNYHFSLTLRKRQIAKYLNQPHIRSLLGVSPSRGDFATRSLRIAADFQASQDLLGKTWYYVQALLEHSIDVLIYAGKVHPPLLMFPTFPKLPAISALLTFPISSCLSLPLPLQPM
jgi:hypothetical protein